MIRISLAKLTSLILLLRRVLMSFIWLNDRSTIAVPTGDVKRMFKSLNISGKISVYVFVDSISFLTSCSVGGFVSFFLSVSAFVSLEKALLNSLYSVYISSPSIRGEDEYVFPSNSIVTSLP